jgi:hypothetical protein
MTGERHNHANNISHIFTDLNCVHDMRVTPGPRLGLWPGESQYSRAQHQASNKVTRSGQLERVNPLLLGSGSDVIKF